MKKTMQLGRAEVSFTHEYVTDLQWSEKEDEAKAVRKPVATTTEVTFNGKTSSCKVKCDSRDQFTYERGRKKSLKKAIISHPDLEDKKTRAKIWADYSKLKPGGRW